MRFDDLGAKLNDNRRNVPSRTMGIVAKTMALLGGAILLASALVLSVLFFAVLLVGGVVVGGYLWWKTREIRKQIRAQFDSDQSHRGQTIEGEIIEGEIIRGELIDDRQHEDRERRTDS